ncbi:MAG TPA: response regulator transcription factor [Myxococcota bacterium]|nr:response regulator transcription factor [Myxococcota bacterium]HRY93732.1 response regulator transcription factor [Myxococcota bacterium]
MKVLIAEDDRRTRQGLVEILEGEGYQTLPAEDGQVALEVWARERPDVVLLDIMMPRASGYDVCRAIRKTDERVPILFLSAKGEELDKVLGLELGADDFVTKPFGVKEVVARIRAVTRRALNRDKDRRPASFTLGDLTVDPAELRARRGQEVIELSLREVKLLELLQRNPGVVLDRDRFFNEVWGYDHMPNSRTLDQHISKLRKRIERDPKNPVIIQTVHGVGYRWEPAPPTSPPPPPVKKSKAR